MIEPIMKINYFEAFFLCYAYINIELKEFI